MIWRSSAVKKALEYIQIKAVRALVKVLGYSTVFYSSLLLTPTSITTTTPQNLADKATDEELEYK